VQRTGMSEKRVKIGKEFEHIPAVKSGRGWLGLEKGKFGRVRFESRSRKLELWIKQGTEWKRTLFPVEEYAKANESARKANKIGVQTGASFGTLRKEEEAALKLWREYVLTKTQAGAPPRPLIDILREAVEREETKDETPLFEDAAFQFMEFKEQNGGSGLAYRNFIRLRLNKLSNHFKKFRLSEISAQALNEAILKIARPRNGAPPSLKTRKHYISLAKEVFKWWYSRENSTRRAADKLNNPLEIATPPKIAKTIDPHILTLAETRALLFELWETAPETVPATVLQLFCGIRTAEALRLRWRDIIDDELRLSCAITKTKEARAVPVPENARAWLNACRARGLKTPPKALIFPFHDCPPETENLEYEARERVEVEHFDKRMNVYSKRIRKAKKNAIGKIEKNVFRHAAVSCLAVLHGFQQAANYCGHSLRTQGANYRNLVSKQDAKDYFNIMPPTGDGKVIPFDRSRGEALAVGKDGAGQGNAIPKIDVANA